MNIIRNIVAPSERERNDIIIPSFPVDAVPELLTRLDEAIGHQRRFIERRVAGMMVADEDWLGRAEDIIPPAAATMFNFHDQLVQDVYPAHDCGLDLEQETTGFGA